MKQYENLIQPVIQRASEKPDHLTYVFIAEDGTETEVTIAQFHQEALAYAYALRSIGIGPEDLVILVLRHSRVLLSAFWGALYLGAIPSIFPFLTEKLDPQLYMERVKLLVGYSGAKVVITFPEFKQELTLLLAEVNCKVLSTADVPEMEDLEDLPPPESLTGNKIAFLQHSSGTTGLQKGVALSHRAVLNQIEACSRAIELNENDVIVSWLPLYHDMGLIAGFVMPIVAGVPLVMMSPFHWIRDPKILLWAIHKWKGTVCWLPNFAFNHLARAVRPQYMEGVDLSSWRAAINCSEPVRHESNQLFLQKFAPYGFRENALAACYGMAENVFAATQTKMDQPPRLDWVSVRALQEERRAVPANPNEGESAVVAMVSCGTPVEGTEVMVVEENGKPLPDRQVGEILVRGTSMLTGYYHRPDITAEFVKEGWYYTGDMGYMADGHVYVSGRKKDLIIVGGKNVYPQDLEAIANRVEGVYPGRAVSFGLFDERVGSEVIVMVCELKGEFDTDGKQEIERQIREKVVQETEVTLSDVRLVEERWLIKTSSGKIARGDNRDKYLKEFRNVHA